MGSTLMKPRSTPRLAGDESMSPTLNQDGGQVPALSMLRRQLEPVTLTLLCFRNIFDRSCSPNYPTLISPCFLIIPVGGV